MKKIGCLFLVVLLIVGCFCFFSQKTDEQKIEERIDKFTSAYNTGDWEKVVDCLNAKSRNAMKGYTNLLGGVFGKLTGIGLDMTAIFGLGVGVYDGDVMNIELSRIVIVDEDNAIAVGHMHLYKQDAPVYFIMTKEDRDWYIEDMTDTLPERLKNYI